MHVRFLSVGAGNKYFPAFHILYVDVSNVAEFVMDVTSILKFTFFLLACFVLKFSTLLLKIILWHNIL